MRLQFVVPRPVNEPRADGRRAEGGRVRFLDGSEAELGLALGAGEEGGEAGRGEGGAGAGDVDEVEGVLGGGIGVGGEGLEGCGGGEGEGFRYFDVFAGDC